MKKRVFLLALAGFFVGSCANEPLEKKWVFPYSMVPHYYGPEKTVSKTMTIEDRSYDQVWEACERSLIQLGFEFYTSDKEAGEMRVRNVLDDSRDADYTRGTEVINTSISDVVISVTRANSQVSLTVSCMHYRFPPNSFMTLGTSELAPEKQKTEVDRIVRAIKKRLRK